MRAQTLLWCTLALLAPAGAKEPFTFEAMMKIARVSEPVLSPDGKTIAFTVRRLDLDGNRSTRQIYSVPVAGGSPVALTTDGNNDRPRWTPDGKQIVFVSTRSNSSQVWIMNADGSGAKQITSLATEASGVTVSPDGKSLVFQSEVYPDCQDEACNAKRLEDEKNAKTKARVYTSLLYRHWDSFQGARRKHLFVVPIEGGKPRDLTPGNRDVPPFSLGGPDDYAISPDGKELCYVANVDPDPSTSTNHDLYAVSLERGEPRKISLSPGADLSPAYSPDGKYLAWRSQDRAGYESDRWKLLLMDRANGQSIVLTANLDRHVQSFTWLPDSKRLAFVVEDRGRTNVQMVGLKGGGSRQILAGKSHIDDVQFTPDGATMIFSEHSGSKPMEIYKAISAGGDPIELSRINAALLDQYQLTPMEDFTVEGAEKAKVHSFVVKPPGFDKDKKYPVLFLIHGGPQGAWGEAWSFRWNPQVFAAAGFVVVMPNPRGSTGYGQKFTDEINDDWGGKAYDDIMAVADYVAKQPWADADRFAAAGGSYGGYMVNWMLGHTDRFKCFVSHAGVYDLNSMGGETEELWFSKWEFKGFPWENPDSYAKWSPSKFATSFKTPTLVIHGELDYRVPYGQGLQLFTALQQQKIPSKLLLFPDEGHWILKPQNSKLWYTSFLDWVTEWTRKPAAR